MLSNVEENAEIKSSIQELNLIIDQNAEQQNLIENQLPLISDDQERNYADEELLMLKKNNQDNIEICQKLQQALQVNEEQREILKDLLIKFNNDLNEYNDIKSEITIKGLQLQQVETTIQNIEIHQKLHQKNLLLSQKEEENQSLQRELSYFKAQKTYENSQETQNQQQSKEYKNEQKFANGIYQQKSNQNELNGINSPQNLIQSSTNKNLSNKSLSNKNTNLKINSNTDCKENFNYNSSTKQYVNEQKKNKDTTLTTKIELFKSKDYSQQENQELSASKNLFKPYQKSRSTSTSKRYTQEEDFENFLQNSLENKQLFTADQSKLNQDLQRSITKNYTIQPGISTIENPTIKQVNLTAKTSENKENLKNGDYNKSSYQNIKKSYEDYFTFSRDLLAKYRLQSHYPQGSINGIFSSQNSKKETILNISGFPLEQDELSQKQCQKSYKRDQILDTEEKNPMESETEGDMVLGSPDLEKTSRTYYQQPYNINFKKR